LWYQRLASAGGSAEDTGDPMKVDLYEDPHRRFNPLTHEWVLVSPHRTQRPWRGQLEASVSAPVLAYDPGCYLCPGNERSGGARNPKYEATFVFTNDFSALKPEAKAVREDESGRGLLLWESEAGTCKVVCFSPRHDLTLCRFLRIAAKLWAAAIRIRMDKSGPTKPYRTNLAKNRRRNRHTWRRTALVSFATT
jgi:galactose-1-phosphate uridylyltransferase (family 1)